ncbi:polysaccharide pyruvyl transferase family protein [Clostridiales bacterium TF09-2AC]|nr:polysaccharide pyruvyl transferase family protein [Clostridiales bacterium TF09-2AC]
MKINIITRHTISNYGSILQAFALQNILENFPNKEIHVSIIDYWRYDEHFYTQPLYKVKATRWNNRLISKAVYILMHCILDSVTEFRFRAFQKQLLHLTSRYNKIEDLKSFPPDGDIYCTGSDQVWGPIGKDSLDLAFFLDFGEYNKKRISYAASFGNTNVIQQDLIKKYLQRYNSISVREKSAHEILNNIGIYSKSVLDPTLLLSGSEWDCLLGYHGRIPENYILIYQMKRNPQLDSYANQLSKTTGYPLIRISPLMHQYFRNGKSVILPSVEKFLAYIKNASYLVTDSFHGSAFAINYGVQFMEFLPESTWTRNKNLLELFDLESRIVTNEFDEVILYNPINYDMVHKKLEKLRKNSLNILKEQLETS